MSSQLIWHLLWQSSVNPSPMSAHVFSDFCYNPIVGHYALPYCHFQLLLFYSSGSQLKASPHPHRRR